MKKVLLVLSSLGLSSAVIIPTASYLEQSADETGEDDLVTKTEIFTYTQSITNLTPITVSENETIYNFDVNNFNNMLTNIWETYSGFGPSIQVTSIDSSLSNLIIGTQTQQMVDVKQASLIISKKDQVSMTSHRLVIQKNPKLINGEKNFFIEADFISTNNTTYENIRLANFPSYFALSPTTEQNLLRSTFVNTFTIDFTFHLSIAYTDKTNDYTEFRVPVHDPAWWSPLQLLEMFNGSAELGDSFRIKIMDYIYSKTNVRVTNITFQTIKTAIYNETTGQYTPGEIIGDISDNTTIGTIDATNNTYFYTGISSTDASGTFYMLLKYKGPNDTI